MAAKPKKKLKGVAVTTIQVRLMPSELAVVDHVSHLMSRGQPKRSEAALYLMALGWEAVKDQQIDENTVSVMRLK